MKIVLFARTLGSTRLCRISQESGLLSNFGSLPKIRNARFGRPRPLGVNPQHSLDFLLGTYTMILLLSSFFLLYSWYIMRIRANLDICNWLVPTCFKFIECTLVATHTTTRRFNCIDLVSMIANSITIEKSRKDLDLRLMHL